MTALLPIESATLKDCGPPAVLADHGHVRQHVVAKHWQVRHSVCLADAITDELRSCVDELAAQTQLGSILAAVEHGQQIRNTIEHHHLYRTEVTIGRYVDVRVDPRLRVLRLHLQLVLTYTIGEVTTAITEAEVTPVSIGATLRFDGIDLYSWTGKFSYVINLNAAEHTEPQTDQRDAVEAMGHRQDLQRRASRR